MAAILELSGQVPNARPQILQLLGLNARGEEIVADRDLVWLEYEDEEEDEEIVASAEETNPNGSWLGYVDEEEEEEEEWRVRGASEKSLEKLERVRIEGGSKECSICLEEMPNGVEAIRMPKPCFHVYHQHCILEWLTKSNTCPLCRYQIPS